MQQSGGLLLAAVQPTATHLFFLSRGKEKCKRISTLAILFGLSLLNAGSFHSSRLICFSLSDQQSDPVQCCKVQRVVDIEEILQLIFSSAAVIHRQKGKRKKTVPLDASQRIV